MRWWLYLIVAAVLVGLLVAMVRQPAWKRFKDWVEDDRGFRLMMTEGVVFAVVVALIAVLATNTLDERRAQRAEQLDRDQATRSEQIENVRYVRSVIPIEDKTFRVFERLDLRGANLAGLDLSLANFRNAQLAGADLRRADLTFAQFQNADLEGADLRGATIAYSLFRDANLNHADLRGAHLQEPMLCRTTMFGADFRDATSAFPLIITTAGNRLIADGSTQWPEKKSGPLGPSSFGPEQIRDQTKCDLAWPQQPGSQFFPYQFLDCADMLEEESCPKAIQDQIDMQLAADASAAAEPQTPTTLPGG